MEPAAFLPAGPWVYPISLQSQSPLLQDNLAAPSSGASLHRCSSLFSVFRLFYFSLYLRTEIALSVSSPKQNETKQNLNLLLFFALTTFSNGVYTSFPSHSLLSPSAFALSFLKSFSSLQVYHFLPTRPFCPISHSWSLSPGPSGSRPPSTQSLSPSFFIKVDLYGV